MRSLPATTLFLTSYFAYARYDVRSPIVGVADTSPEGGSEKNCVFASVAKQTPGRVEVYGGYAAYFFGGIAAVATLLIQR